MMAARALLIATTVLYRERLTETPYSQHPFPSDVETVMAADELAEFAARSRNLSWDRPNPGTSTNRAYLKALLDGNHFREMDHASATFYVTGVSHAQTQSLMSEHALSCSPLSPRYVDYSAADHVAPDAIAADEELSDVLEDFFEDACDVYEDVLAALKSKGYSDREAEDAALSVLPGAAESSLVVTGTMHAWRDVIAKRAALSADTETRTLAWRFLRQLRDVAPNTFQDMPLYLAAALTPEDIRETYAIPDYVLCARDDCDVCRPFRPLRPYRQMVVTANSPEDQAALSDAFSQALNASANARAA